MLQEISFGPNYFIVANLLRHSLFLSSVLLNSEAWYALSLADVEQLEIVDQALLRRILETPSSTPNVSLYLEMGCLPIRYVIKTRRMMFLHYILNQKETSLIHKFFKAQPENPVKGDWCKLVNSDLKEINLRLSLEEIKELSLESFRTEVKKAVQKEAFKWLIDEKNKKSKVNDLKYEKLEIQNYLGSKQLNTTEKKLLFQLRTRMIDVKTNFRNMYSDTVCPVCEKNEDEQKHVLECEILLSNISDITTQKVEYEDIFRCDMSKQTNILKIFQNLWKKRKKLMKQGKHPFTVSHVI